MSRWQHPALSLALGLAPLAACGPAPAAPAPAPAVAPDLAALEAELLAAHEATLAAHRAGDWRGLAAAASDPSLSVSRGRVEALTRAATEDRFRGYFAAATFTRYGDLSAPITRVAVDGSLGWVIAQVRVEGSYRLDDGGRSPLDATWGWIELYERSEGGWRRVGTVSDHDEGPSGFAGALGRHEAAAAEVLAAAERALGGREALAAIQTIETSAAVTTPRGGFQADVVAAADGRVRLEQRRAEGSHVVTALADGTWVGDGAAAVAGAPSDRVFAAGHALHLALMSPTRLYTDAKERGEARFAGQGARALELVDALGNPVRIYYATATDLPLGLELVEPGSDPPAPIVVEVAEWRPHGTTRAFHRAVFKHRGDEFVYEYGEIAFNSADPALLRRPASTGERAGSAGG